MKRRRPEAEEGGLRRLPPKVIEDPTDGVALCVSFATFGFALVRLAEQPRKVDTLRRVAPQFFQGDSEDKRNLVARLRDDEQGFGGFHAPNRAKEVFRFRSGLRERLREDGEDGLSDAAWELMEATYEGLWASTRTMVLACLTATGSSSEDADELLADVLEPLTFCPGSQCRSRLLTPPMDIFRYYNRKDCKDVNCEPHVDPGLITVIPVSATPGLSVWHPGREEWWPVEQLVQSENEGCKRPRPGSAVIDGAVPEGDSGPVAVAIVGEALDLFTAGLLPARVPAQSRP